MSTIHKYIEKIKLFSRSQKISFLLWFCILTFVFLSVFFLGMIYERKTLYQQYPIRIEYSEEALNLWNQYQETKAQFQTYFASRNGSVVYPVGCSRGNTIKEENKIFFSNLQQALNQGYREATGC